jgi:rod shape-determining protein MreD
VLRLVARPVVRIVMVGLVGLAIQATLLTQLQPFDVTLQVMLLLAASTGIAGGPERGALAGFLFGLMYDLILTTPFGVAALSCGLAGYVAGFVLSIAVDPTWWLSMLFVAGASAVGELAFPLVETIVGREGWVQPRLFVVVPVVAIANGLMAPATVPIGRWCLGIKRPR